MIEQETRPHIQERHEHRTDDPLFNVRYLARHIIDREVGLFFVGAEHDVYQQNLAEVGEASIHSYAVHVTQHRDPLSGEYVSLGASTIQHAARGIEEIKLRMPDAPELSFELARREVELLDERMILDKETLQAMQGGEKKVFISPSPTHHEADIVVAQSLGYDDRTMIRIQELSGDGAIKTMHSFTVFDVPATVWAHVLAEGATTAIEPTAQAVMEHTATMALTTGEPARIVTGLLNSCLPYVDEDARTSLQRQAEAFLLDQERLEKNAHYYAKERTEFQKQLALSMDGFALPLVSAQLDAVLDSLNDTDKHEVAYYKKGGMYFVTENIARIASAANEVTTKNRAGLASRNERTIKAAAARLGLETAIAMADTAARMQRLDPGSLEVMQMRYELDGVIAQAGLSCGGGCSVDVVDLFSEQATVAKQAGLKGTLYEGKELDKSSKCACSKEGRKAKVVVDGSSAICVTCGEYSVRGRKGKVQVG